MSLEITLGFVLFYHSFYHSWFCFILSLVIRSVQLHRTKTKRERRPLAQVIGKTPREKEGTKMTTPNLRRVPKTKGSRKVTMMIPRTRRRTKVNLTRKKAPVKTMKTKRTEAVLRQAARRANHHRRMKKNGKELMRKKAKRSK